MHPRSERHLKVTAGIYGLGLILHTADHFRRGVETVTPQVTWLGTLGIIGGVVVIGLVLLGHSWAPRLAAVYGLSKALGVSVVHLLPPWGAFSDSFLDGATHPLSWAAVAVEIAGAALLGLMGCWIVARQPRTRAAHAHP